MSLNATLYLGIVSIYGAGSTTGISGIVPPPGFLFGIIDQTWASGGDLHIQTGQSVMFKDLDVIGRFVYSNWTYTTIIQDKIILIEAALP